MTKTLRQPNGRTSCHDQSEAWPHFLVVTKNEGLEATRWLTETFHEL